MNYMEQVAEMLGVKLGEEFRVKNSGRVFKLIEEGCYSTYIDSNNVASEYYMLSELLSGRREIEKPILNKKEKEYLENVLRPFKDKGVSICKRLGIIGEGIVICVDCEYISLPYFKKGTMYKGMELEKEYTLEELGLFEDE